MKIFGILFNHYSLGFFIHLLVMMLIFVNGFPRKDNFYLRFLLGLVICLPLCYFFPEKEYFFIFKPFFLITFFMVCVFIRLTFEVEFPHVTFYCAAMYVMQNLSYHIYALISAFAGFPVFEPNYYIPLNYIISFLMCAAVYYFCVRKYKIELAAMLKSPTYTGIVFLNLFIVFILNSTTGLSEWDLNGYLIVHTLLGCCCALALLYQFGSVERSGLETRTELMERILHLEQQQHEMTKDNIRLLNIKSHDIKHQINLLRKASGSEYEDVLKELEHTVTIYDATAPTGNDALDVLLMEKKLMAEQHGIRLACMAEGEKLSFMAPSDIYSLFGNMLDNAIENVIRLEDPEKRVINFNMAARNAFLVIHIENYFHNSLVFENGLPKSTKGDSEWHGFGMQSMKYITDKYGGKMTVNAEGEIFSLDVVIPIPAAA